MMNSKDNKPFSFFPEFDKEANNKLISQIFAMANSSDVGNPLTLLIGASKNNKDGRR